MALAPLAGAWRPDPAGLDPERPDPSRVAVQSAGRKERVEEPETEGGLDRGRPEVALDPVEDRLQSDELAGRVKVEKAVDEPGRAVDDREALGQACPDGRVVGGDGPGPLEVRGVKPGAPLLAAALAAADRAGVELAGRGMIAIRPRGRARGAVRLGGAGPERLDEVDRLIRSGCSRPDDLVERQRPAAGRAARRERLTDGDLQAGLAVRRRAHRLERGVEVAEVRRPQDELREEPGQGRRFEADRAALAVDRGAPDPAPSPGKVEDDVAGLGVGLDPGGDQPRRRRRGEAIEERQRVAGLRSDQ